MLQKSPRSAATRRWTAWIRPDAPHWWLSALVATSAAYVLLILLVMAGSWFTDLDTYIYDLHLVPIGSPLRLPVQWWVFLGQRAPAMIIGGAFALYFAYRRRTIRPLVLYGLVGIGFVGSVLVIKYLTGRVAPRYTDDAHTVWDGGNIFPSGHVTGTVVMYGLIAVLAPVAYRKLATIVAVVLAVTVGAGTTALNLHWSSDVFGGWLDGVIVLLVAWAVAPRVEQIIVQTWRQLVHWHRSAGREPAAPFDTTALRHTHSHG